MGTHLFTVAGPALAAIDKRISDQLTPVAAMAKNAGATAAQADVDARSAHDALAQRDVVLRDLTDVAARFVTEIQAADRVHAEIAALAALALARIGGLTIGAASLALVALNGTGTVTVPLSRPMPDTSYRVEISHTAVVDLTKVKLEVTAKTKTAVTVKVTTVGVALAAGTLIVAAV